MKIGMTVYKMLSDNDILQEGDEYHCCCSRNIHAHMRNKWIAHSGGYETGKRIKEVIEINSWPDGSKFMDKIRRPMKWDGKSRIKKL